MAEADGRGSRLRCGALAALAAGLAAIACSAAAAEPYVTELEWIHPDPESVEEFRVWLAWSEDEKLAPTVVPVGKPQHGDRFVWGVQVDEQNPTFVAVVAVGRDGLESAPSEWRRIDWRPGHGPLDVPGRPYLVDERGR